MEKLKVLIVEDDRSLLALYDIALQNDIFEKRLVDNGKAAVEVYCSWRPDIILLDRLLPKITGEGVLKEIRKSLNDKSTTVIISSSIDLDNDIWWWKMLGIQGHIVKPFDHRTLSGEILEYYKQLNPVIAEAALVQLRC